MSWSHNLSSLRRVLRCDPLWLWNPLYLRSTLVNRPFRRCAYVLLRVGAMRGSALTGTPIATDARCCNSWSRRERNTRIAASTSRQGRTCICRTEPQLYPPLLQAAGCSFAEPRAVSDTESKLRRQGPELRTQERWNR